VSYRILVLRHFGGSGLVPDAQPSLSLPPTDWVETPGGPVARLPPGSHGRPTGAARLIVVAQNEPRTRFIQVSVMVGFAGGPLPFAWCPFDRDGAPDGLAVGACLKAGSQSFQCFLA
jgi:hypothetical protein